VFEALALAPLRVRYRVLLVLVIQKLLSFSAHILIHFHGVAKQQCSVSEVPWWARERASWPQIARWTSFH
jgi:hypothetical protein